MAPNPGTLGQFEEKAALQTASGGEIQILDAGCLGETGLLDPPLDASGISTGTFAGNQQRQEFFEAQFGIFWVVELLLEPIAESGQAALNQFIEQGLEKHGEDPYR